MVETAKEWVPRSRRRPTWSSCLAHTGQGTVPDADYVPADLNEDVANNIATQVPGIDVVVTGHSHQDVPETVYTNVAGEKVLVTQPNYWAQGLTEVTLNLVKDASGDLRSTGPRAAQPVVTPRYARDTADESTAVVDGARRAQRRPSST